MVDFPSTPISGQTYTYGSKTYMWNGEKWTILPGAVVHKVNVLPYTDDIDVSAASIHKISTNEGNPFSFQNIPAGSSKWTVEIDITNVSKYDVTTANATAAVNSKAFGIATPYQVAFRPDGSQYFVAGGSTNPQIYTYNLSSSWNIASANTGVTFSIVGADNTPIGLTFDPEGRYMYVGGYTTKTVYQYTLSQNWNVATATLTKTKNVSAQTSTEGPLAIKFKPDGTKMFLLGSTGVRSIYEYTLSTAWDVSTATFNGGTYGLTSIDSAPNGFDISNNGRKIFVVGDTNNMVAPVVLTTPWQVNTAVYTTNLAFTSNDEGIPVSVVFKPDGTRMFLSGLGTDTLREYVTTYSGKNLTGVFTFPINVRWAGDAAPTISANTECIIDFITPDGGTTIYGVPKFNRII